MLKMFAFSRYPFNTHAKAVALLDCLASGPYPPVAFSTAEPVRQKLTDETRDKAATLLSGAPRHKGGTLFLKSTKPNSTLMFQWHTDVTSDWYAEFDAKLTTRPEGRDNVTNFLLDLFREFPVVFAGVASDTEWNAKHWKTEEYEDGGEDVTKLGLDLAHCLPGIYWMTVFGEALTLHFGRKKLLSLSPNAIDLGTSGVAVTLAADPVKDREKLAREERRLIQSLGEEFFFDIGAPDRACTQLPGVMTG